MSSPVVIIPQTETQQYSCGRSDHQRPQDIRGLSPSHVTKHSIINMVGGIVSQGLKLGVLIYVARTFSTADFGLFSFSWGVYAFMLVLANFGLPVFGAREVAKAGVVRHDLLLTIGLGRAALAIVSSAAAVLLLSCVPGVRTTEIWLVALFGLSNFTSALLFDWAFQGLGRLDASAVLNMLLQGLWLAFTFVGAHFGRGIVVVGLMLCLSGAVTSVIGYLWLRMSPQLEHQKWALADVFRNSWKTIISGSALGTGTVLITVLVWTDVIAVRFFRGQEAAGIYSAGNRMALGLAMLATFFVQGAFPLLSRTSFLERDLFEQTFQRTYDHLAMVFLPGSIWTIAYAVPILHLVFGRADYVGAARVFQIFQVVLLVFAANTLFGTGMVVAFHRDRAFRETLLFSALLLLIMCPILTWRLGIEGAAASVLVSQMLSLAGFYMVSRELAQPNHLQALLKPFIAGIAVVAIDRLLHIPLLWGLVTLALAYTALLAGQWRHMRMGLL